ncbi:amino acid transporter, partial [Mycobacterium tuberculosis]|nr:amino acid transporter [Mycobacterium tuberculosis]
FSDPAIADLTRVLWINIPITVALTAVAAWISYRGVEATEKVQVWLVAFQVLALGWFVISALVHVATGTAYDPTPVQLDWFNPVAAGDFSTI